MKESKFKIGRVVRLKSGGPWMTVCYILTNDRVGCHWFNQEDKIELGNFSEDELQLKSED